MPANPFSKRRVVNEGHRVARCRVHGDFLAAVGVSHLGRPLNVGGGGGGRLNRLGIDRIQAAGGAQRNVGELCAATNRIRLAAAGSSKRPRRTSGVTGRFERKIAAVKFFWGGLAETQRQA